VDYAALKLIHQFTALLSVSGFLARGVASFAGAAWVRGRPARTLPHVVDTLLLSTALALARLLRLNPLSTPWLAAKISGLPICIALGMRVLRAGRAAAGSGRQQPAIGYTSVLPVTVCVRSNPHPAGRGA
jgi:uncharacterized membrane protein SirB2